MGKAIREFDLDAPTLPRHLRSEFRYQTRSLTSLYERCFGTKLSVGKAWKILIELVPSITFPRHRDLLGALVIQIVQAPNELLEINDDLRKNELALTWLVEGVLKFAAELGLERSPFLEAADQVRALGFQNIQSWMKPRLNMNGNLSAFVVVDHDVREARLIGRIVDAKGSVVCESLLAITRPNEFIFAPMLGSLQWTDHRTVELRSKDGKESWSFQAP